MIYITRPKKGFLSVKSDDSHELETLLSHFESKRWSHTFEEWVIPEIHIKKLLKLFERKRVMINEVVKREAIEMAERLRASRAETGTLSISLPPGLSLYPFQVAGVEFIERSGGRTLLADEVGLGKGVQTLAWLNLHLEKTPIVVVCPNTMKLVWEAEARRWLVGKRKIKVISGVDAIEPKEDFLIINYDILEAWADTLYPRILILDEPQAIKNRGAIRSKAAVKLAKKAQHVIGLSATPVLNRPAELWNELRCIQPNLFPKFIDFSRQYCIGGGASNLDELEEILRSKIMIRRLKRDVLTELPEVTRQTIFFEVEFSERYKDLETSMSKKVEDYKNLRAELRAQIEKAKEAKEKKQVLAKSAAAASEFRMKGVLIAEIGRLRQEAALMKFEAGMDWVRSFLDSGQKLVVFAWHIEVQEQLFEAMVEGYGATSITGMMTPGARKSAIRRFQEDENCRVIVCSIMCASEGITLTAASTMVAFELPWNPARVDQMVGRISRIGQKNACNAYFLVAEGTIEEKMAQLIDNKQIVTSSAMGDVNVVMDDQSILESIIDSMKPTAPSDPEEAAQPAAEKTAAKVQ